MFIKAGLPGGSFHERHVVFAEFTEPSGQIFLVGQSLTLQTPRKRTAAGCLPVACRLARQLARQLAEGETPSDPPRWPAGWPGSWLRGGGPPQTPPGDRRVSHAVGGGEDPLRLPPRWPAGWPGSWLSCVPVARRLSRPPGWPGSWLRGRPPQTDPRWPAGWPGSWLRGRPPQTPPPRWPAG